MVVTTSLTNLVTTSLTTRTTTGRAGSPPSSPLGISHTLHSQRVGAAEELAPAPEADERRDERYQPRRTSRCMPRCRSRRDEHLHAPPPPRYWPSCPPRRAPRCTPRCRPDPCRPRPTLNTPPRRPSAGPSRSFQSPRSRSRRSNRRSRCRSPRHTHLRPRAGACLGAHGALRRAAARAARAPRACRRSRGRWRPRAWRSPARERPLGP